MFKKILSGLLVVSMCASLIGCGGSGGSGKDAASTGGSDAAETSTIKVAVGTDLIKLYEELAKKYEQEHEGTKVELVEIVASSDMYTKITIMMQSPQTCPDLITEDGFMINSDASADYLTPLDDFMAGWEDAKQFEPAILDGAKGADGVQYGVPFSTDTQGIWYNKKLLEKAGVTVPFAPKNWTEILDAANKLKVIGGKDFIPLFLYASKTSPEETSMRTFQELYAGTGGELYDFEAQKWIVDQENLKKVYDFIDQVYNIDKVGPPLSIASQQKVSDLFQSDSMKNDKLGLYFSGSWEAGNWGEGKNYEWAEGLDHWGFAKIPTSDGQEPGYATMSGGWTWAVPANANNKDGGMDFLKFVANKENQLKYALQSGNLAVRKDVMAESEYLDQQMSVVKEAGEMLQYAHFRPSVEGYSTLTTMFTEVVESIAMGASTPDQAVAAFESEMKRIVGEDKVVVK